MEISNNSSVNSLDAIQQQVESSSEAQEKNLASQSEAIEQLKQEEDTVELSNDAQQRSIETEEVDEEIVKQEFQDDLQTGRSVDFTA